MRTARDDDGELILEDGGRLGLLLLLLRRLLLLLRLRLLRLLRLLLLLRRRRTPHVSHGPAAWPALLRGRWGHVVWPRAGAGAELAPGSATDLLRVPGEVEGRG